MAATLIQGTISRLGYTEDGVYYREPDCFDGLRDLIRFLHNDDREMTVRRICATHNIIKHDLVPIMKDPDSTEELFDASLRLAVNLCQPTTLVLETARLDEDEKKISMYCELESGLVRSLPAFVDPKFYEVLAAKLKGYFNLDFEDRAERKKVLIERIIVLLRYIFAIGYDTAKYAQVQEVDHRIQESVICTFLKSEIPAVIFDVISSKREREFNLHFLSIFALTIKPFSGTKAAAVGEEAERIMFEKEKKERQLRLSSSLSHLINSKPRPPPGRNFLGGVYEMKGLSAINKDRSFIVNKPLAEEKPMANITNRKSEIRVAKNKKIVTIAENSLETGSDASPTTLVALKTFTNNFIERCYNTLMKQSKDQAFMSNQSLTHKYSEIYFFIVVEYVMEFARIAKCSFQKISQTFSKEFFHMILSQLQTYFEMMKTDKQSARFYALKAQHAVSAYKQIVLYLNYLDTDESEDAKDYYDSICHHIFQLEEYREVGYTIMTLVSPSSSTRKLLEELVIMNHYYLHIMEREVKRGELRKINKKKRKVARKKKVENKKQSNEGEGHQDEDNPEQSEPPVQNDADINEPNEDAQIQNNIEIQNIADVNELDEDDHEHVMSEVQFNMDEYLCHYARQDIISWYIFLLKDYSTNSLELNKAILKLFHRIAFDLKSPSRLFLASFFRILSRLNAEIGSLTKAQQKTHVHFDLYRFGFHLLTKFFETYKERGNILVNEILFSKTAKECYEIEHGYGSHSGSKGDNKDILWPEELEEEVKNLHREYTDFDDKPEGLDVIDFITANLSRERTRAQVLRKVKKLYL